MNTLAFAAIPLVLLLTLDATPAQRLVSPQISADRRVTFRLRAPDAQKVQVHCEGVKQSQMEKDDKGVWSLTTEPLEPDIYAYSFVVDGVHTIDPSNPLQKYNLLNTESQVHVPGPASLPWEVRDVPHGEIHRHFYRSAIAGDDRDFYVYTPPGYEPARRYPVLYLLHGFSDDASAWCSVGCANVILDNLIDSHHARPMLVVMPLGYGTMKVVTGGWEGLSRGDLWQTNLVLFRRTLMEEVMPRVQAAYRVRPEAEAHAIAGLSMGGTESLLSGLNALDRFAYVGAFSSGGLNTNFPAVFPGLKQNAKGRLRLLWLGCGEQDGLLGVNQKFSDWLTQEGVHHTFVHTPGQHSFRVWRRYLADFAPLLFHDQPE